MKQKTFEVEVVYRQTVRYQVDARDRETAEREAVKLWMSGQPGVMKDGDCCVLHQTKATECPDADHVAKDAEKAYRFIRDRELVLEKLDTDAFNPTVHDALSAEEIARRLGWTLKGHPEAEPDLPRASRALDLLVANRRLVSFTRPRVRRGERGEIRLFSTPQHLERLAALLEDPTAAVETAVA